MRWLDLFSGIGMYALGLEQAGHEVIGFCEKEPFCQRILKKHWPMKPISSCINLLNARLTALSADFPVRIYPLTEKAPELSRGGVVPWKPEPVQDFSGKWSKPFAWYDQDSGLWRTWQRCLLEGWARYLGPWPPAGMMRNGIAWERAPLAHPTIAPEHTFLPTLAANESKGACRNRFRGSPNFKGSKMSEGLRICATDPLYTDPLFAETVFGLPPDWTLLETETRPVSSEN